AADEADDHADERADPDREQAHPERDASAVDDAAQDVAADVVGAEWMCPARRRQTDLRLRGDRIVRRDDVGEDRRERQKHDEARRPGAERLAPQGVGELVEATEGLGGGLSRERRGARDGHERPQWYRMRGSSHAYVRSTIKFSVTTAPATSMTLVCTTG